jgi:hypothetical protein
MTVRGSMSALIAKTRLMIADLSNSPQFTDQNIQDQLDANRDDIRYYQLIIAPSIVNIASTGGQAETIYADYYSGPYTWWESDVVLQAQGSDGTPWTVVTPLASDYIVGHWQFELDIFNTATVPGQVPPVFATGKVYDLNCAAAELLEFWSATLSCAYDIVVDGQNLRRSQLMTSKLALSSYYRKLAKPKVARMVRRDVAAPISSKQIRLLDGNDTVKGA